MTIDVNRLQDVLRVQLRPRVKEIDEQGVYPGDLMKGLGEQGFYSASTADQLVLIREVATVCGSTAFVVWCQAAAIGFVQNGGSEPLKRDLSSDLLAGRVLGGTGISNAMKMYAGMEELRLAGERTATGYRLNGSLPFVSNLGPGHWFGVVFHTGDSQRAMAFVPSDLAGLRMVPVDGYLGLNGTATYSCQFDDVEIPQDYILADPADEWIAKIRPGFVLTQAGMALGLTQASIASMLSLKEKQNTSNRFLKQQPEELEQRLGELRERADHLAQHPAAGKDYFKAVVQVRLDSAYLALDAAQAEMLHAGAAGYAAGSATSRRLRESLFLAVVTPAVKQLEKILQS